MNIEVVVPHKQEIRDYIDFTLGQELGKGIFKPETKAEYIKIMTSLIENQNVEGIILGCTEIPLIINQDELTFPVFNTTKIHSLAAVEFSVGKLSK